MTLTDRQFVIVKFALKRFYLDALDMSTRAAQDKTNQTFKEGAYEAFNKDFDDALDLYKKLGTMAGLRTLPKEKP